MRLANSRLTEDIYSIKQDLQRIESVLFDPDYETTDELKEELENAWNLTQDDERILTILKRGSNLRDVETMYESQVPELKSQIEQEVEKSR